MKPMTAVPIAVALTLAGCNIFKGLGQDIQKAGDAIERASTK